MADFYASYLTGGSGGSIATGNLTDVGTDGMVITNGTGAVVGTGTQLAQHVSDATHNGYLSSVDWSTFNAKQAALTIGNLTDVGTDGIVVTGGTSSVIGSGVSLAQHVADASHNGYLSSSDWSSFNGKQASGNYITALSGDVTAAGPGSVAATVAKIQSTTVSGTTGSGNVVFSASPTLTGTIVAAAANFSGAITASNLSGTNTGDQTITLTSDVTGSGTGSFATTIAAGAVTNAKIVAAAGISVNKLAALTVSSNVRSDASGFLTTGAITLSGADVTGTLGIANGGTGQVTANPAFNALSPLTTKGDLVTYSSVNARLGVGTDGQALVADSTQTVGIKWLDVTDPTAMSNSVATRLGYKAYASGTTYNGGIAPTITLASGAGSLSSVANSAFYPKQLQDGTWTLSGTMSVILSASSRASLTLGINAVTFAAKIAATGFQDASNFVTFCFSTSGASTIDIEIASANSSTNYYVNFSNIPLSSKPSWAY